MAGNPFAKSAPAAKKPGKAPGKAPFPAVKATRKGLPPAAAAGMPRGFKKGGAAKATRGG